MEERRRAPRIQEENEVAIRVVSGGKNLPEEQITGNYTKDISVSGVKIQTNILLPVNALIELDFKTRGMQQQLIILGKINWRKTIIENESYELGVEFYPGKEIDKLDDYISWQLKPDKPDFTQNAPPRIDSANKRIVETVKLSPMDSGYINIVEIPKAPPMGSSKKNIADTKKAPPIKNNRWIIMAICSLGTIILIVVLLNISGYLDLDFIDPHKNKKVTNNIAHVSITTKSATLPAPPIAAPEPKVEPSPSPVPVPATAPAPPIAAPEPKVEPSPSPVPVPATAPALKVTPKTKVIGNSDSKLYHLPGMKYYNAVKAYHRVEFDSETDAIKAGYNKAPK